MMTTSLTRLAAVGGMVLALAGGMGLANAEPGQPPQPGQRDLTPCVGHAQSQECPGGSEMIQPDGKEKLPR